MITISAILTHTYISITQICLTIEIINSIQIHYHISVYYNECITYLCCIISLLACIYCILLANNAKLNEIKKLGAIQVYIANSLYFKNYDEFNWVKTVYK
ncbi:hypothetical protein M164_0939 [Sulfolobus islandicus M.16.4]|uniref:Uncharacterized protein n=1 Tax=Saccharolobus islandicus (strain M.16.4 / Kamchatka \|nr:hypothetical protein M164_0939 [Sulfolobus islandicus M.16.4]